MKPTMILACTASLAILAATAYAQPHQVEYCAEVPPDHASLQQVFSTQAQQGTSWYAVEGFLKMTTASGRAIWFGNETSCGYDPVAWDLADNSEGNVLEIRARLEPQSGEWNIYFYDGQASASFFLWEDRVGYGYAEKDASGTWVPAVAVLTNTVTKFHTYSMSLVGTNVTYYVDGTNIFSGRATPLVYCKALVIRDGSATSATGYGSMVIDWLRVISGVRPTLALAFTEAPRMPKIVVSGGRLSEPYVVDKTPRLGTVGWSVLYSNLVTRLPFEVLDIQADNDGSFYRVTQPELEINATPRCLE